MWLHSSVGRASHRYRGGHGFESRWSLDFFRLLISNCLNWKIYCDDHSSLWQAGIVGFELGFEKKDQFARKWDQDTSPPPSGPSVEKQRQQIFKLRITAAQKSFFCHEMNKSASTGGFSLPKEFFVKFTKRSKKCCLPVIRVRFSELLLCWWKWEVSCIA